jgi:hypothetical protein
LAPGVEIQSTSPAEDHSLISIANELSTRQLLPRQIQLAASASRAVMDATAELVLEASSIAQEKAEET